MLKLMKYELRKTWLTKLILLGIAAVLEIVFLIGLYADKDNWLGLSIGLLTLLAIGGLVTVGVQSVVTLHRDMNTRQSYMLFMTPHSCYTILGAKVLENGLSILLGGAFFFGLGALDLTLMAARHNELNRLIDYVQEIVRTFNEAIPLNMGGVASLVFSVLAGWISSVTMAYLAVVISTALLTGKKWNGFVSFLFYIILNSATSWIVGKIAGTVEEIQGKLILTGGVWLLFACVMYVIAARIMEKDLSV